MARVEHRREGHRCPLMTILFLIADFPERPATASFKRVPDAPAAVALWRRETQPPKLERAETALKKSERAYVASITDRGQDRCHVLGARCPAVVAGPGAPPS